MIPNEGYPPSKATKTIQSFGKSANLRQRIAKLLVYIEYFDKAYSGTLTMRITFILPTVSLSGGIRVVVIYAQALMRMGHMVRIISSAATIDIVTPKAKVVDIGERQIARSGASNFASRRQRTRSSCT